MRRYLFLLVVALAFGVGVAYAYPSVRATASCQEPACLSAKVSWSASDCDGGTMKIKGFFQDGKEIENEYRISAGGTTVGPYRGTTLRLNYVRWTAICNGLVIAGERTPK